MSGDFALTDQRGTKRTFTGEFLTSTTTAQPGRDRWVDMALYWHADGGYVMYRCGQSVRYHRKSNTCGLHGRQIGVIAGRQKVPLNAMPCPDCKPSLADVDTVRMETARPIVDRCSTAADVLKVLTEMRRVSREPYLSEPARRIIVQASGLDSDIAEAWAAAEATAPI